MRVQNKMSVGSTSDSDTAKPKQENNMTSDTHTSAGATKTEMPVRPPAPLPLANSLLAGATRHAQIHRARYAALFDKGARGLITPDSIYRKSITHPESGVKKVPMPL